MIWDSARNISAEARCGTRNWYVSLAMPIIAPAAGFVMAAASG